MLCSRLLRYLAIPYLREISIHARMPSSTNLYGLLVSSGFLLLLEVIVEDKKLKIPACVIVDDEDREYLEQWQWHMDSKGYCVRNRSKSDGPGGSSMIRMHRVVLERKLGRPLAVGMFCDHVDGNRANDSRTNLREVTRQQNDCNRRGARGYCWHKRRQKWQARITVDGRQKFLGYFDRPEDARDAHLAAKAIYHKMPGDT